MLRARKEGMAEEKALIERLKEWLESDRPLRATELTPEDEARIRGFTFLSLKPLLVVLNLGEERAALGGDLGELAQVAERPKTAVVAVQGQLEMEIARLDAEDRAAFMADLGISESALDRVIRKTYELLGLISFFTVGEDEVRAWTIGDGTPAVKAAGVIHSDIERGFIRAEVIDSQDLLRLGSLAAARDAGLLRLEGKEYRIRDGEVVHYRFNVGK